MKATIFLVGLIFLTLLFFGCAQPMGQCGNRVCDSGENKENCPSDCISNQPANYLLVTTDKTRYVLGETITITVENRLGKDVFYNVCNGISVAGKGWAENCNFGSGQPNNDKTIVRPPCPAGVSGFEDPLAISKIGDGKKIIQKITFNMEGKLPICVQARIEYFDSCNGNNCTEQKTIESDWIEIVKG